MKYDRKQVFSLFLFWLLSSVASCAFAEVIKNDSSRLGRYAVSVDENMVQIQGSGELSVNTGAKGGEPDAWTTPQPFATKIPACPAGFRGVVRYSSRDTEYTAYQGSGVYYNSTRLATDRYQPICVKGGFYTINICGFAYFNSGDSAYAAPINVTYQIDCVRLKPGDPIDVFCSAPEDSKACAMKTAG